MNKEIIKDELRWLLEAINEQFEAIRKYDDKIPQIEFDILMENVRKMYESMRILQRLNEALPGLPEPGTAAAPIADSPGASGLKIRFEQPADMPPPAPEPARLAPEPVTRAPEPVRTAPEPARKVPEPVKPIPEPRKEAPPRKQTKPADLDLFAAGENAFGNKLVEAREKTFGPKIPSTRIDNLKAAININDKFMFINELFEGNLREYNETIETLNGFINLNQAAEFLDLVKRKNFWDTGSAAFKKLKELVERKF